VKEGVSTRAEAPNSLEAAAQVMRAAHDEERALRFVGGGTKSHWGNPLDDGYDELSTTGLDRIIEHNAGDLTIVVESGVPFGALQATVEESGQMFAVDPYDPGSATIGGVVATGDSGPLRHRYGAIRDLVLGVTVVLPEGTVAKSGGKVIKNVAGYDLGKLFTASFGTLGLIGRVALRLHPKPPATVTLRASTDDAKVMQEAVIELAAQPLELESLDLMWSRGAGTVLARFAGSAPEGRVEAGRRALHGSEVEIEIVDDDNELWDEQRRLQRSDDGMVLKISGLPATAARIASVARDADAELVGRAGLGLYWMRMTGAPDDLIGHAEEVRAALSDHAVVILDAPDAVRRKVDVWGVENQTTIPLMQRIKERFDPRGICNRGIFVAGI
jgi:glycolate oxidase FAD binding subunit